MRVGLPVSFLFLIFSINALAENCPGPDIRLDAPGGSMEFVKKRTQFSNDCYAYAGAEVWDAYRFSHYPKDVLEKEKKYYSNPLQAALQFKIDKREFVSPNEAQDWEKLWAKGEGFSIDYGDPAQIIKFFMNHQGCVTDQLDHDLFSKINGTSNEKASFLLTLLNEGSSVRRLYHQYSFQDDGTNNFAVIDKTATTNPLTHQNNSNSIESLKQVLYKKYLKNLGTIKKDTNHYLLNSYCTTQESRSYIEKFIREFFNATENSNNYFSFDTLKMLKEAIEKTCRTAPPLIITGKSKVKLSGGELNCYPAKIYEQFINNALNGLYNNPIQPITTAIHLPVMFNGLAYKSYQRTSPPSSLLLIQEKDASLHSQIVIGRRSKNGSCEFLIRDSGAPNCKNYNKLSKDWLCDVNGYDIWVNSNIYTEAMVQFTLIQDRGPEIQ